MYKETEMSSAQYLHATQTDLPRLKQLWTRCFPQEDPLRTGRFFSTLFSCDICYVAKEGDKLLCAVYALPYEARLDGAPHRVVYLYRAMTEPAHRGRGIFTALHAYLCKELAEQGFELLFLLPPTEDQLKVWLKKPGYRTLFYRSGFYTPSLPSGFVFLPPQPRLLYEIYRRSRANAPGFHILEDYCSFCFTLEGKQVALDLSGREAAGYVIYSRRGEGFIIHDYPAIGKKRLCGAGRTVPGAPAMPLGNGELFDRLYKTKPRLNFLLN